ncbi:hypothetical protein [Nitrosopumilus sp.]|uniref:hypothetical protein n=1 Tax=Nitrosopumilus sp. TaxID=2024843 RepID=UPI003D0E3351
MAQVSKDSLDVSSDFIESGKSFKSTKKRGGPYSKDEKIKRQNEVYRLHFEYGYSARKIAELMKINRNTINDDIIFWYVKIASSSELLNPENAILVSIQRFNVQRSRLRENLDKAENFHQKQAIEKMIFDIDSKILSIQLKLESSMIRVQKLGIDHLNNWLKKNKKDERYLTYFDTISVSEKAQQRISKIIKDDQKKIGI